MNAIGLGVAAAIAFGAAAFLMFHGKDGWGWLIFAGIMACGFASDFARG